MAPKFTEKEWLEDFKDFVSQEDAKVPEALSQTILNRVHRDLHPSGWIVFAKLLGIHTVMGTLSLAVCDQFGMSPFNTSFSLAEYFMRFGHSFCMTLCGFLFLSFSLLIAWILLRPEELQAIRKNAWIQIPSLALLSLAGFMALGAEILLTIAALWFIGALLGGFMVTFLSAKRPVAA